VELVPVASDHGKTIYLRDVATWHKTVIPGEYDRLNQQRYLTVTANIHNMDLATAIKKVNKSIASLGKLPRGDKILLRGQADLLTQTRSELQLGLLVAVVVIFLMIAASFQSFRTAWVIMSIIPVVISGSLLLLFITGNSLNIQSYMGLIMAVGVAVANGILFVTSAEDQRRKGNVSAYREGAYNRLRPIMMTCFAMIAGMLPMSSGIGRAADQVAPLGIAVIGGLAFSLLNILFILPLVYHALVGRIHYTGVSLDPEDHESKYFIR
jgi:multidrug efflux pump subunit AcrB